jgi:uncharacterized membrane protein YphA (DoxX/SURF4 family)
MFDNALDVVALADRVALGGFFILARFRWVYDPSRPQDAWFNTERHKHLVWKLCTCHYPANPQLAAFVAMTELAAGAGVLFGLLTNLAALGLLGTLVFATACTARAKVLEQGPVDVLDVVCDYLWRVEGLYILLAASVFLMGGGAYSLDAIVSLYL